MTYRAYVLGWTEDRKSLYLNGFQSIFEKFEFPMKTNPHLAELSAAQLRQYIDAEAVFSALEQASKDAAEARGSMFWHFAGSAQQRERSASPAPWRA